MKKILLTLATVASTIGIIRSQDSLNVHKLGRFTYSDVINDVWGYAHNGNEYALVGVNSGFSIVDVTIPSAPVEKHFIAGANTIWRDIKTWSHYAYVVHDGVGAGNSDGILIVDLNTIDSNNISYTQVYPSVTIGGSVYDFHDAHNLYIDENGVLYVFGSNIGVGGACMFSLVADPDNPAFLGVYDGNYLHDGVARGDTLWGAAIYTGKFEAIDVSNKAAPVVMASHHTPNNFTHNIWFSDDNKTVFTTDEKKGAFITAYDVSNLNNITELDRIQTSIYDPTQVIPHNTHVKDDFLVSSYYTSGLQIVDASVPDILVETGYYDTSPFSGDGYNGAWGAYPFLPSGNILVSDRQEGLFILSSTYPRACFLSVFVKDSVTQNPILNADITMVRTSIAGKSDINGIFKDGQRDTGSYLVVVEKPGYHTDTLHVNMSRGIIRNRTVALIPFGFSMDETGHLSENISVYPNPTQGKIEVDIRHIVDANAEVQITDMSGRVLYRTRADVNSNHLVLDPELAQGVYILKLTNGDVTYASRRIVVER